MIGADGFEDHLAFEPAVARQFHKRKPILRRRGLVIRHAPILSGPFCPPWIKKQGKKGGDYKDRRDKTQADARDRHVQRVASVETAATVIYRRDRASVSRRRARQRPRTGADINSFSTGIHTSVFGFFRL
jgi:hypothetical protein